MVLAKVQMEGARPRNGGQLMLPANSSTGKPISIKYVEVLFCEVIQFVIILYYRKSNCSSDGIQSRY